MVVYIANMLKIIDWYFVKRVNFYVSEFCVSYWNLGIGLKEEEGEEESREGFDFLFFLYYFLISISGVMRAMVVVGSFFCYFKVVISRFEVFLFFLDVSIWVNVLARVWS